LGAVLVRPAFVLTRQQATGANAGRTAMRGFKEDFDAWRSSLTPEERALVQKQAQGEFNKKFRKSDEFKKDLPKEKVEAFSKILSKFFDNEAEDYKKETEMKTPDYDALFKRRNDKFDFSLKSVVVEIDRDADRRYRWALIKIAAAQEKGELFPNSSPLQEIHAIPNSNEEEHQRSKQVLEFLEKAKDSASADMKSSIDELLKKGVPPVGEKFDLMLPQVMCTQHEYLGELVDSWKGSMEEKSDAEKTAFFDKLPEEVAGAMKMLEDKYIGARDEIQANCDHSKEWFKSQNTERYKTKADVMKAVWEVLPRLTGSPVPPIDEELLADLEQQPAVVEGDYRHSWGIADKLYKSEAIDAFGMKYLLGIFETKDEAQKAFADWNNEYEKARVSMKADMEQWGKSEQARLDKDTYAQERIKSVLSEARR
jgi:hypothetical protein